MIRFVNGLAKHLLYRMLLLHCYLCCVDVELRVLVCGICMIVCTGFGRLL